MGGQSDVVIVGGGQGGLAASWWLTQLGVEHVVLERGKVGQAWRAERWDSFCLVTPNWTITLPGAEYRGADPDGFMPRDDFVRLLDGWAGSFACPVRQGVHVRRLHGEPGGFVLDTDDGPWRARAVVVATATHQVLKAVPLCERMPRRLDQRAATAYRNPRDLPDGAVLVIGGAQTGCQIAEELHASGRATFLSVGRSGRLPRRYRGRDCIDWQRRMGWLDRTPDFLDRPADRFRGDPHLSGGGGGHTISLHDFRARGVRLLGRLAAVDGEIVHLADDLEDSLRFADTYAANFYDAVEGYLGRSGETAPEPTAHELWGGPPSNAPTGDAISRVDLAAEGVTSVIWATGFTYDFGWIDFPVRDAQGYPATVRGQSAVPGLAFNGLNWMHKRKSGIIYGVGEDGHHVASAIAASLGIPVRR